MGSAWPSDRLSIRLGKALPSETWLRHKTVGGLMVMKHKKQIIHYLRNHRKNKCLDHENCLHLQLHAPSSAFEPQIQDQRGRLKRAVHLACCIQWGFSEHRHPLMISHESSTLCSNRDPSAGSIGNTNQCSEKCRHNGRCNAAYIEFETRWRRRDKHSQSTVEIIHQMKGRGRSVVDINSRKPHPSAPH